MSVGKGIVRRDGPGKVTGRTRYIDDLSEPGMWFGKTVRATIPHGRIRAIRLRDDFPAEAVIVDYRDIPGKNVIALIEEDQPCLAQDRVMHQAEPILLVAAATQEIANRAAAAVEIEYEPKPPVFSIEASLRGEEILFGQDNVFKSFRIEKGSLEAGFAAAQRVVEGTYRTGAQEQLYIEPNGMIAMPDGAGGITIKGSMQCPYYVHRAMVVLLGLPPEKVRVIATYPGGGFGGKEEYPSMIAGHAALLALKAGRPVKLVYPRDEDMLATTKRHPSITRHRSGVKEDGTITAMEIDLLMDGGAYATLSSVVLSRGAIHAAGVYKCENVRVTARVVATNHPPYGAFRGFGAPQACFAVERQIDRIADVLGLSPAEVRRRNMIRAGDTTLTGQRLTESVGTEAILDRAIEVSGYTAKRARFPREHRGNLRRGIGLSLFMHGTGFTGSGETKMAAEVGMRLTADGTVEVLSAATDMGQGTETIFAQIAAATLGIPPEAVRIVEPDTARVPNSGPTVASRTCMVVGSVVARCAETIRERLQSEIAEREGIPAASIEIREGMVLRPGKAPLPFAEAAAAHLARNGPLEVHHRYRPPAWLHWDEARYQGDAYPCYSFACDVIEVEVDLDTFEVRVCNAWLVDDIGTVINPVLAAGQVEGGTLQGLGYALSEEVVMAEGRMANHRLTNYIIPTTLDAPRMHTEFLAFPFSHGPFGAKGVGELPFDGVAPAVLAAIDHAIGTFLTEIPATPERIMKAWKGGREGK